MLAIISVFAVGASPEQITEVASRGYDEVLSAGETLLSKGLLKEREAKTGR